MWAFVIVTASQNGDSKRPNTPCLSALLHEICRHLQLDSSAGVRGIHVVRLDVFQALRTKTRRTGPIPAYTHPTLISNVLYLLKDESSIKSVGIFLSVAMTTPVCRPNPDSRLPLLTAFNAYSICNSLPVGLNVVSEKFKRLFVGVFEFTGKKTRQITLFACKYRLS